MKCSGTQAAEQKHKLRLGTPWNAFQKAGKQRGGGRTGEAAAKKEQGGSLTRDTLRCILNFTKNRFYWVYWIIWAQRSCAGGAASGALLGILPAQVKSLQEASFKLSHKAEATASPNSSQKTRSNQQTCSAPEITPCFSSQQHRACSSPHFCCHFSKVSFLSIQLCLDQASHQREGKKMGYWLAGPNIFSEKLHYFTEKKKKK